MLDRLIRACRDMRDRGEAGILADDNAVTSRPSIDTWGKPVSISSVWGADGGAYGRVVRLQGGEFVGSLTTFEANRRLLRVTKAACPAPYAGPPLLRFADTGTICEGPGDLDNAHLAELPGSGFEGRSPRLLAAFRNHDQLHGDAAQIFRITVCCSDDGGRSWRYHSEPACTRPPHGLWEPFLFNAPDASLHVYYARERANHGQDVVMQRSEDGGRHWQAPRAVGGGRGTRRDGMPGVTCLPYGAQPALFMVFETNAGGPFCVMSAKSVDHGLTWTDRADVYTPAHGRHAGAPQVARVNDRLVVIFMTDEDAPVSAWPQHARVKAVVSTSVTQNGVTWSKPYVLTPPDAFWPGICDAGGDVALYTYNHRVAAARIGASDATR